MRFIPIGRAVPGMVLSKEIFDAKHQVLLFRNMELTQEFIDKLQQRGLPGFYIDDDISKDIVIEETVPTELRSLAVDALMNNDIDGALNAVQDIVYCLRNAKAISLDLMELRTFDDYTYAHSVNVAILATVVGIGMNLTEKALIELCTAAILHDMGKLKISSDILNKPSRLTPEEYEIMKKHSELSYDLIKNKLEISAKSKFAVLFHHENIDGSGYPKGLKGEEIHLFARIIHVVDVYDALTTARPYKSAYSPLESIEYLMGGCGIMFDPEIVKAFMKYIPIYPKGISVMLSNGEEAIVVSNHFDNMSRPIVRTLDGRDIDLMNDRDALNITIVRTFDNSYTARAGAKRDTRKHVLIVDDMIVNLKAAEGILNELYRVSAARSATQALSFLKRKRPDLILMDIDMPEMNGIDLAKKIKSEFDSTIPIIFVSSLSNRDVILRSKEAHAEDYVLKPYRALYLLDRVSRVLGDDNVVV